MSNESIDLNHSPPKKSSCKTSFRGIALITGVGLELFHPSFCRVSSTCSRCPWYSWVIVDGLDANDDKAKQSKNQSKNMFGAQSTAAKKQVR